MKRKRCLILARIPILLAGSAIGLLASNLGDAAAKADAVVIGTVTSLLQSQSNVTFDLTVERVLSGAGVPATVHISHNWNSPAAGAAQTISVTVTRIWLLIGSSSGNWDVVPCKPFNNFGSLFFPASALPPAGVLAYPTGAPLQDSLTFETAWGLLQGSGDPLDLLSVVSPGAPSTAAVLGAFTASPLTSFQAIGLAGMLQTNTTGAISKLASLWPQLADEPRRTLVVWALGDDWRDTTPAGVSQLAALVNSPAVTGDLRAAAIKSLAATHTAASLPVLSTLLFDGNLADEIWAAIGISAFVNGCNMQTPATVPGLDHLKCSSNQYGTSDTLAHGVFGIGPPERDASDVAYWQSWWSSHPGVH